MEQAIQQLIKNIYGLDAVLVIMSFVIYRLIKDAKKSTVKDAKIGIIAVASISIVLIIARTIITILK